MFWFGVLDHLKPHVVCFRLVGRRVARVTLIDERHLHVAVCHVLTTNFEQGFNLRPFQFMAGRVDADSQVWTDQV